MHKENISANLNPKQFSSLGMKKLCYLKIELNVDEEENFVIYNADGTVFAQRYNFQSAIDLLDSYGMTLVQLQ